MAAHTVEARAILRKRPRSPGRDLSEDTVQAFGRGPGRDPPGRRMTTAPSPTTPCAPNGLISPGGADAGCRALVPV